MSKKKQKPMTDREYVRHDGLRCPNCRERAVESRGNVQLDGPGGCLPVECTSCGATWSEGYDLTGYCNLQLKGPTP